MKVRNKIYIPVLVFLLLTPSLFYAFKLWTLFYIVGVFIIGSIYSMINVKNTPMGLLAKSIVASFFVSLCLGVLDYILMGS